MYTVYTKATSLLSMRERVPVNARTSLAAYTQIWMVHGPVLTRERAPRAARAVAVSDTMLERSVPHLFSSFFFSIPSPRRALASDISSYILAISILFTIFFFPSLPQPFHLLLFLLFLLHGRNDSLPSNLPSPLFTRAISLQYVPDSTLSCIYAFLSLLLLDISLLVR